MDADQIEKIAKDANDTSTKAYNLLLKTLDGENRTSHEIDELNKKYVAPQPPLGPSDLNISPKSIFIFIKI